jgi:hypothetical protein
LVLDRGGLLIDPEGGRHVLQAGAKLSVAIPKQVLGAEERRGQEKGSAARRDTRGIPMEAP